MQELEYPFDPAFMLKNRRRLKRALLAQNVERIQKRIAVLGGSTTHDIVAMLELFLLQEGIAPIFYESEYNQYWQDAMFDPQTLQEFSPDLIWIHTTTRNLEGLPLPLSAAERDVQGALDAEYARFEGMWEHLAGVYHCPLIQNNFDMPPLRLLGNRDGWDCHGLLYAIGDLNRRFGAYAREHADFYILDVHYLSAAYGLDAWHDESYWYLYKYVCALGAIPDFAYQLARIVRSIYGKNKKVLALDLDNTIWGGVIGDDGQEGIAIGRETAEAEAYTEVQEYCKAQTQLGVILTICSKNDPENALLGLRHPDSVLKEQDFVTIAANWEQKDQNLLETAENLGLLPESFVFLDDNPAEREIVRAQIPGAAVPPFDTPQESVRVLDHAGYFETTAYSAADAHRSEMYRENAARANLQKTYASYTDYLLGLQMRAEIADFNPVALPRIVQLTNKSNQFNLTTRRYTQSEMEQITACPNCIRLYGRLLDKFGDNGIVSVVFGKIEGDTLHVELWLMSCRVLKRDMEYAMLDMLVEKCRERGVAKIRGYYYKTAKNSMVQGLYDAFGFAKIEESTNGDSIWEMAVDGYQKKNHVIAVEG